MATEPLDAANLQAWIGRKDYAEELLTAQIATRFLATLAFPDGEPARHERLLGIHWCLAPQTAPMAQIGADGHPQRGDFLPPIALPRRMWAGGELEFAMPLGVGETMRRSSTIENIAWKKGRSGALCFVTVRHDIASENGLVLRERQDIVYRAGAVQEDSGPAPAETPAPDWQRAVPVDPVLLFRYSALTFNGHRIHYDRPYCVDQEHYQGLVVHGPLQATLLLRFAAQLQGGRTPRRFSFRSKSPLFDGADMTLNARKTEDGLHLWTGNPSGHAAMTAQAQW